MNERTWTTTFVALRILAIFFAVRALQVLVGSAYTTFKAPTSVSGYIQYVANAIPLVAGVLLWINAGSFASRLADETLSENQKVETPVTAAVPYVSIGIALIAIYWLVTSIVQIVFNAVLLGRSHPMLDFGEFERTRAIAALVAYAVQAAAAIALIAQRDRLDDALTKSQRRSDVRSPSNDYTEGNEI